MNKKKYVQIRFESKKCDKSFTQILHNTRTIRPGYLRNNMYHNKFDNVVYVNNTKYELKNRTEELRVNKILKEQLQNEVKNIKKESKSFRIKKSATTLDSVITLSNKINFELENGLIKKEKVEELFLKSVKKIEEKLGLECLNIVIHYDEKTPHAHVSFKNYYEGKGISNLLKKQYTSAQDILGEVWSEIGYTRGKKNSNNKHLSVKEMHEKEKEIDLKNELKTKKDLQKYIVKYLNNSYTNNKKFFGLNKKNFIKDITKLVYNLSSFKTLNKLKNNKQYIQNIDKKIDKILKENKELNSKKNMLIEQNFSINKEIENIQEKEFKNRYKLKKELNKLKNELEKKELELNKIKYNKKDIKKSNSKTNTINF